jgi:hypothetical protein
MEDNSLENSILFILFAESFNYTSSLSKKAFDIYKYNAYDYLTYIEKKSYQIESKILYHTMVKELDSEFVIKQYNLFQYKLDSCISLYGVDEEELPF